MIGHPVPGPRPATAHMAYRRGAGKPQAEFPQGRRPVNSRPGDSISRQAMESENHG